MYIEAVTVCVNYSDYAAWTIPQNKQFFDSYTVVTNTKDKDTIRLCEDNNVRCVQTNILDDSHKKFEAINVGLGQTQIRQSKKQGFLLYIDCDIWLPHRTKYLLESAKLNLSDGKIYGIDRLNVKGFDTWIKFLSNPTWPVPLYENFIYLHLAKFEPGARVIKTFLEPEFKHDGAYVPLGFFQLWSEPDGVPREYPTASSDYSRADMEHACNWPREKRELIPEIVGLHLMTDDIVRGTNWNGRKSKRFGP